jgi:hypothetical protein
MKNIKKFEAWSNELDSKAEEVTNEAKSCDCKDCKCDGKCTKDCKCKGKCCK